MFRNALLRPAARLSLPLQRHLATSTVGVSISNAIKQDHRELETYYDNILSAADTDTKVRWQNQFIWELARHSIAEELVVYPAFEKYLPADIGKTLADKDRSQHNDLKLLLSDFQKMYPTDAEFEPTVRSLYAELKQHIAEEEKNDLVELEKALPSKDDSEGLAKKFERTKMFVPTKSHPLAPDKPPFETVAGLMSAPLDRLRDVFERFPKEDTPGKRPPKVG